MPFLPTVTLTTIILFLSTPFYTAAVAVAVPANIPAAIPIPIAIPAPAAVPPNITITITPTLIPINSKSIICLKPLSTGTAHWINAAGQHCTWTGTVGGSFGHIRPDACHGRCGVGCKGFSFGNV